MTALVSRPTWKTHLTSVTTEFKKRISALFDDVFMDLWKRVSQEAASYRDPELAIFIPKEDVVVPGVSPLILASSLSDTMDPAYAPMDYFLGAQHSMGSENPTTRMMRRYFAPAVLRSYRAAVYAPHVKTFFYRSIDGTDPETGAATRQKRSTPPLDGTSSLLHELITMLVDPKDPPPEPDCLALPLDLPGLLVLRRSFVTGGLSLTPMFDALAADILYHTNDLPRYVNFAHDLTSLYDISILLGDHRFVNCLSLLSVDIFGFALSVCGSQVRPLESLLPRPVISEETTTCLLQQLFESQSTASRFLWPRPLDAAEVDCRRVGPLPVYLKNSLEYHYVSPSVSFAANDERLRDTALQQPLSGMNTLRHYMTGAFLDMTGMYFYDPSAAPHQESLDPYTVLKACGWIGHEKPL
jgi:hypothetical protein